MKAPCGRRARGRRARLGDLRRSPRTARRRLSSTVRPLGASGDGTKASRRSRRSSSSGSRNTPRVRRQRQSPRRPGGSGSRGTRAFPGGPRTRLPAPVRDRHRKRGSHPTTEGPTYRLSLRISRSCGGSRPGGLPDRAPPRSGRGHRHIPRDVRRRSDILRSRCSDGTTPPERFQLIRFLDEVDRPSLHRLDRGVDRPLARDHDHGGLGPHHPETMQDLQSGGFGHPKVEEGHVERLPLDRAKRFTPVRGGDDGVSVLTQERGELFPEGLVVIRDENLHAASLRGRRTVTVVPRPGSEATSRDTPFFRFRGVCETADRTTDRRSVSMGWICRLFERLTNPWTILAARRRSVSIFSSFPSATGSVTRLLAADVRREIVVRGVFNSWAMKPASWPIVASRSASKRRSWARLRSMAMATCSATKLSTRLSSSSKRTPSA